MRIEKKLSWQWGEPVPAWLPWFGLLFLLLGLAMLGGAFWFYQKEASFEQMAASASGTVIDLMRKRSSSTNSQGATHDSITYSPVVQFIDLHGKTQMLYATGGSNPPAYRRGEIVTVLYEPDNPEFAVIDDWQRYMGAIIPSVLGLIFSLLGLLVFLFSIHHKAKKTPI